MAFEIRYSQQPLNHPSHTHVYYELLYVLEGEVAMTIRGRDLVSGLPKSLEISAVDVATAIQDVVQDIIVAIKETLELTSPEIAADVIDHGIVLTGGGALLKNLPEVISDATKVPVFIAQDPLDCVAIGTGESLKHLDVMRKTSR